MRIGVLGGTFDPPHNGHLALAEEALASLQLDEVMFLPAGKNPLKTRPDQTQAKHRLEMVKLATAAHRDFAVIDIDVQRKGPSYTVDTMTELSFARPADYWFLIGADNLKSFHEWKHPEKLLKICRLGVGIRPPQTDLDVLGRLPEEWRERIDVIRMQPKDVSSSEVRERLVRGQSIAPWVPAPVAAYIKQHNLYRS
jgi:nicotinate-nucleotide adenylyltransferase